MSNLFHNKDPLVDAVKSVMDVNEKERQVRDEVLKEFGVSDRKALPHERQVEFDAKFNTMLNESKDEKNEKKEKPKAKGEKKEVKEYGVDGERERAEKGDMYESHDENSAAHELVLHADNDSHLYRSSHTPIVNNLKKKHAKGTYDHEKAKKLWGYHADRAAQSYAKQHGDGQPWHKMFPTSVRRKAAEKFADQARDEHLSESVVQLDELSRDKLTQYIKKAKTSTRDAYYGDDAPVMGKRSKGINLALRKKWGDFEGTKPRVKATNEETIEEALKIRKGIDKTHVVDSKGNVVKTFDYHGHSSKHEERARDFIKIMKKYAPSKVEVPPEPKEKKKTVKEETLNELSRSTLGTYIKKASVSAVHHGYYSGRAKNNKDLKKSSKKATNRIDGIKSAVNKLSKKDAASSWDGYRDRNVYDDRNHWTEENLNELSKTTLKNYVAKKTPKVAAAKDTYKGVKAYADASQHYGSTDTVEKYKKRWQKSKANLDLAKKKLKEENINEMGSAGATGSGIIDKVKSVVKSVMPRTASDAYANQKSSEAARGVTALNKPNSSPQSFRPDSNKPVQSVHRPVPKPAPSGKASVMGTDSQSTANREQHKQNVAKVQAGNAARANDRAGVKTGASISNNKAVKDTSTSPKPTHKVGGYIPADQADRTPKIPVPTKRPPQGAAQTTAQAKPSVANKVKPVAKTRPAAKASGVEASTLASVKRDAAAGRYQKDANVNKIAAMRQKAINTARAKRAKA